MRRLSPSDLTNDDPLETFDHLDPEEHRSRRRRARPRTEDREELEDPAGYSTWGQAQQGPLPRPDWVVTAHGARDTDRGVLKTGKEADVHLVERHDPVSGRTSLLAAKRYRSSEHRMFHRDAGYLEGRRVRKSRETRAMARRTDFGRDLIAAQWAIAEFEVLSRLWQLTRPGGADPGAAGRRALVPYPVQLLGRELMMEFIGTDDGSAAQRLTRARLGPEEVEAAWRQTMDALSTLARAGLAHADLSPYNVLVGRGDGHLDLVLIDLPQVVDVVANPRGRAYLERDVRTMVDHFQARGLPPDRCDTETVLTGLLADAGLRP